MKISAKFAYIVLLLYGICLHSMYTCVHFLYKPVQAIWHKSSYPFKGFSAEICIHLYSGRMGFILFHVYMHAFAEKP